MTEYCFNDCNSGDDGDNEVLFLTHPENIQSCMNMVSLGRKDYMTSLQDLANRIEKDEKDVFVKMQIIDNLQAHINDVQKSISNNQVALYHLRAYYNNSNKNII